MKIRSQNNIYNVLEEHLRHTETPLTCNDLWDADSRIRDDAESPNQVSDFLGFMWRKNLLVRYPSPKTSTSFARFAYLWKHDASTDKPVEPLPGKPVPLAKKHNIQITEIRDGIVLDMDSFTITIKTK